MKTLLLYALLAIGAQWVCAQSTIVYTPGPMVLDSGLFYPSASIDMNQDGTIDFTLTAGPWLCTMDIPTSYCSQSFFVQIPGTNSILNQGTFVASIPHGEWIGNVTPSNMVWFIGSYTYLFTYWNSPRYGTSGVNGPIGEQGEGYFGIRFTAVDGEHYGWVHVQGQSIGAWAYEIRPNQPIRAGAKPVPVPLPYASVDRPGYLRLVAETESGKAYQVQVKDSLLDFAWSNLSFALPAGSTNTLVDIPLTDQKAFYRVVEAD